jgi:predicted DNA-binding transcriptional regulator AlpA
MDEGIFLTKKQIADRYQLSVKSVNTMCSVKTNRPLPPFMKLGPGSSSPIRFRMSDVLAWEEQQAEIQRQRDAKNLAENDNETSLEDLLGL